MGFLLPFFAFKGLSDESKVGEVTQSVMTLVVDLTLLAVNKPCLETLPDPSLSIFSTW